MATAANRILSQPPESMLQLEDEELHQLHRILTKLLATTDPGRA
jgi:hypothetical protein